MRTTSRMIAGGLFALGLALAAGCGSNSAPTQPEAKTPLAPDPAPPGPTPPQPNPGTPTPPGQPPAAWEMDTEKHRIPDSPVSGHFAGAAFTPKVQVQGNTLTFQVLNATGLPERQIDLKLPVDPGKTLEDRRLVVKPDSPAGPGVPEILTQFPPPKAGAPGGAIYQGGYALTLELGKRKDGQLPGKVYLSLPGEAEKNFLAGSFTAEWVRPATDPPGPDDAPFIQGKVTVTGPGAAAVKVGYAARPSPEAFVNDSAQLPLPAPDQWTRSNFYKPRMTTLVGANTKDAPLRYDHVRLTPGRYCVFAAVPGGPAAWKWVDVAADTKLTLDFAIDAGKIGSLEVAVPAGVTGKVDLAPADEPGRAIDAGLFKAVTLSLEYEADIKDGKARYDRLAPGRYEVRAGDLTGTVEVKPGETAKLDLGKK